MRIARHRCRTPGTCLAVVCCLLILACEAECASIPASRIVTGTVPVAYSTKARATVAARIDGVELASCRGIELTIASQQATQLKLVLFPPRGPARVRYLVFCGPQPVRTLALPLQAFDEAPSLSPPVAPGPGAIEIVDCPGFFRDGLTNRLLVGPIRLLDRAPAMPADETAPGDGAPGDPAFRRLLGGWIGKVSGGAIGMPNEGRPEAGLAGIEPIVRQGLPAATWGFGPDDDTSFEAQHLLVVAGTGRDFAGPDLVRSWLRSLSREYLWKSERYALNLMAKGIFPPRTGENPYGESICARIRADLWGYLAPGDPARALELVERDAPVSNCGEGVAAARLVATLVALAFKGGTVVDLVRAALDVQPDRAARHCQVVRRCLEEYERGVGLEAAYARVKAEILDPLSKLDPVDGWVQAVPNTALLVLALLHGRGDFARTVAIAASLGWDADCNAASAGCILGVLGTDATIPARFRDRLHDRLTVAIAGREHWSIRRLAHETLLVQRRMLAR